MNKFISDSFQSSFALHQVLVVKSASKVIGGRVHKLRNAIFDFLRSSNFAVHILHNSLSWNFQDMFGTTWDALDAETWNL